MSLRPCIRHAVATVSHLCALVATVVLLFDRKQAASRRAKELLEEHSSLERENSAHLEQIRRLQSLVDALQKYKLDTEPLEADYEQLKVSRATWRRSDVIGRYWKKKHETCPLAVILYLRVMLQIASV